MRHVQPSAAALALALVVSAATAAVAGCSEVPPPPGGPRDQGTDSGRDPNTCEVVTVEAAREAPEVLILLDRSGSMYIPPSVDRWTPAVAAINQAVASYAGGIAFGLGVFGEGYGCGAGRVRVNPGGDTASAIASTLSGDPAVVTGGGTPTAAMLTTAARYFTRRADDRPGYVVLVTDGAPNCNPVQGARTQCLCTLTSCQDMGNSWLGCLDDRNTIDAVGALAAEGIPTWVIGYDTPELASTLDAMAVAGDTGRTTYIPVEDQATLSSALDGITAELVTCTYSLSAAPGDPSYIRVLLDGDPVPHSSQTTSDAGLDPGLTGTFVLEGGNRVRLEGAACDRLQDGQPHDLTITRECEPVIFE